jgi:hypothetical protein
MIANAGPKLLEMEAREIPEEDIAGRELQRSVKAVPSKGTHW